MVDKNDPLMREVDEALRREQMERLWDRYGGYLLAGAAAIVAIVGGYQIWDWRKTSLAEAGGAKYQAALDLVTAGKADEARVALDAIVADGSAGYAALAQLQLAGMHLSADRPKDALAVFEALATNRNTNEQVRTFAALQAASLRLGEADFTEMKNRLNDLANGASAWRIPARELLGTAAFKAGNNEEARTLLAPLLADPGAPRGTLERVQLILGSMASGEAAKAAPAPAAPDSDAKDQSAPPAAGGAAN